MNDEDGFSERFYAMRWHERNDETFRNLNTAAIEDARLVLKALFTINGGSAIALLAFAGANAGDPSQQAMTIADLVEPARFFAYGVSLAVLSSALAYCVSFAYAHMRPQPMPADLSGHIPT